MSGPPPAGPPPAWSADELATLGGVAETFVRGAATRRANLAAAVLDLAGDPVQVARLRMALRLFERPSVNLLLGAGARRFRDMPSPERERYLLSWATSRIAQRRSAYQALRKLLTFLAYADPGEPGSPNPHWLAMGYRPEAVPVTDRPTPIRPLAVTSPTLEADVVVVGSGAGAGVIARELTIAGRSVVILESGPFVPEPQMPTDEMTAFDRLYLDHGLTSTWDGAISILAGAGVGGGTTINWMTCLDAPPAVREEWSRDHGLDGFDAAEGDEDYAAIRGELGVTTAPRLPPKDAAIVAGARALGIDAGPTERNADSCTTCGSCPFGCRAGTKRSGLQAHLADASLRGARLVAGARVERILVESGRARGVEATLEPDAGTGAGRPGLRGSPRQRLTVHARQVVLAAGALRSPAILVQSGLRHPATGRYLRLHPVPVVAGRFTEPIEMWNGVMQAARSTEYGAAEPGRNGYVIESAPGHPGLIALAFGWEGSEAHAALMARVRSFAPLIAITRDGGEGRVSLTRAGSVRIDYALDPSGRATLRHALVRMARIIRAAGAREILAVGTPPAWHGREVGGPGGEERAFAAYEERLAAFDFRPNRGSIFSAHQMGSVRMGANPRLHTCDPRGRVRAESSGNLVGGLYVADASLFPTAIGANPMLTVMALARRVARTVVSEG